MLYLWVNLSPIISCRWPLPIGRIVSTTLTPVVTASLTLPLRGTREPLLNRVLIIIMSNKLVIWFNILGYNVLNNHNGYECSYPLRLEWVNRISIWRCFNTIFIHHLFILPNMYTRWNYTCSIWFSRIRIRVSGRVQHGVSDSILFIIFHGGVF